MKNNFRRHTGLARSACVTLAAILVACADDITRPQAHRVTPDRPGASVDPSSPPQSGKPGTSRPAKAHIVIMERSTDIAARSGRSAIHRKVTKKLVGQARPERVNPADERPNVPAFDVENLPRPPISLPAPYAQSTCAAPRSWKKPLGSSAVTDAGVEIAGFGDAPPSTLHLEQPGQPAITIERTWLRTPHTWQLERQVTTSADGKYRDVVTYQHVTEAGRPVDNAIPLRACVVSSTGTAQIIPARGSGGGLGSSPFSSGSSKLNADECGGSFDFGSDPCFEKRDNVYKADAALVAAGTLLTYWCHILNPVRAASCLPAVTAYSLAVINLKFAQRALVNCLREAQSTSCNCGTGLAVSTGTGASSRSLPGSISAGNPAIQIAGSYGSSFDPCGYDPAPYYPPGGGGTGGTCQWMVWEISYDDGVTWEYLGTFWTCYAVEV